MRFAEVNKSVKGGFIITAYQFGKNLGVALVVKLLSVLVHCTYFLVKQSVKNDLEKQDVDSDQLFNKPGKQV